jgi:hypothetical protein
LPHRIQGHALESRAKPHDVETCAADKGAYGGGIDIHFVACRARLHPQVCIRRRFDGAAVDDLRLVQQPLDDPAPEIEPSADEDDRRMRRWSGHEFLQTLLIGIRRLALSLRNEQLLRLQNDNNAPRHHHRERVCRVEQVVDLGFSTVEPLDVERAQPFIDSVCELRSHSRLLHVVITNKEIERTEIARRKLLAKGRDRQRRH